MPIIATDYTPPFLFKNRHFNTIYSSLFRRIKPVAFKRKRLETSDNDFLDIDFIENGSKKIVILCHGLEGSSDSKYIQATAKILSKNGYSIAALNYRFCSGEINRQLITYHSGKTVNGVSLTWILFFQISPFVRFFLSIEFEISPTLPEGTKTPLIWGLD